MSNLHVLRLSGHALGDSTVSSGAEERVLVRGDIAGHELVHRVADEQIRVLDVVPQVLPDLLLRRALDVDQSAANLNVRAVDDGKVGADLLDERNQTGHLGVI